MATGINSTGVLFTDQGIRWYHRFTFISYDVTGKTVVAKGRRGWGASDPPLWSLTEGSGLTVTQVGADGQVDMLIDGDDLAAIQPSGHYVWELRVEDEVAIKNKWEHAPGAIE
jgi:hypothetical protein